MKDEEFMVCIFANRFSSCYTQEKEKHNTLENSCTCPIVPFTFSSPSTSTHLSFLHLS